MPDDRRIEELLVELLESGKTPEEVCLEHPELLPEVSARFAKLRRVEAEVDGLFPGSPNIPASERPLEGATADLPRIAGYDVESVLARGGMGIVYKARHLTLKRTVAIKM